MVGAPEMRARPLQQISREIELPFVAGDAVKLDQRQFDFRDGRKRSASWARDRSWAQKIIDKAQSGIEKSAVASGAVICDRALQHVPDAIELVAGGLGLWCHAMRQGSFWHNKC